MLKSIPFEFPLVLLQVKAVGILVEELKKLPPKKFPLVLLQVKAVGFT
jgi:hypothetical protein